MIKSHTIENKFLRIKTLNLGATLFEVFYKKKKTNLILNLDKIQSYKNNKNYLGSICGRYANRIENAKFKINNKNYNLVKNEGKNMLHGGKKGFDSKFWQIKDASRHHITYEYISKDGEEGFPGELKTTCRYSIINNKISLLLKAKTNKPTHLNLVNHTYWNLEKNKKDIFDHYLMLNSDYYLENNKSNIPTGKKVNVTGTYYDFRKSKNIGEIIKKKGSGFDENFIIRNNSTLIAKLQSPKNRINLSLYSNQPGVQFYTGQHLKFRSKNKIIKKYQGLCLETQYYPNSPNNKKFPSTLLFPKKSYRHYMKFVISEI
tara:strand:+ start:13 stop:963 length:951 start_codon:yes stop_codon:yes gene_type:complete